jgi:hypothetical protein
MGSISLCQTHKSYLVLHVCVPLGICWLYVNPGCFTPMLMLCGMLGLSAFVILCRFWGRQLCWKESSSQSHWKQTKMVSGAHENEIRTIWPWKTCSFLLNYLVINNIGYLNFSQWPYLPNKGECCWLYVNLLDVDLTFRASMCVPQVFITMAQTCRLCSPSRVSFHLAIVITCIHYVMSWS